ncbi:MAG: PRD domain-containing protein [Propionibacteriaceae bacterium]|nr:PRD domain-containing protein [Propionibacteriaceae bacterium]
MRVVGVFNNNVILARDELGREVVLTGRGIGFQVRRGDPVDQAKVGRRFVPVENAGVTAQVLAGIPLERVNLVADLFAEAAKELGVRLSPLSVVAAADHVHQAVERIQRGETMVYPLRAEVAHLHPEELLVAEELLARLNQHLPVVLPEGEAIALTMHLFHVVSGSRSMAEAFAQSALIRQVFDLLVATYGTSFDVNSVDAARFATHLRYFLVRIRDGRRLGPGVPDVAAVLCEENPGAHQTARRVQALLELRLGQPVSEEEVAYLTLHIARLEAHLDGEGRHLE